MVPPLFCTYLSETKRLGARGPWAGSSGEAAARRRPPQDESVGFCLAWKDFGDAPADRGSWVEAPPAGDRPASAQGG